MDQSPYPDPDYERWRDELEARAPLVEPDGTVYDHGEAFRMSGDFDSHGETMEPRAVQELFKEWRDDAAQRPMTERGVKYEDEYSRQLDRAAERGKRQEPERGPER